MRLDPAREELRNPNLTLAECYELCRRVQAAHSRTYFFSTRLLPLAIRPHVHALYAFMRYADEIVDNPGATTLERQLAGLEVFHGETVAAIDGEDVANPVLRAYADTVRTCGIEVECIHAFVESMKMDTHVFRYPTYADLEVYTYGSAAVVGLMMCHILGVTDERAKPHAKALGVAMQLSNFLRDIQEDWQRGRIYLPLEDLRCFGYLEQELEARIVDDRFASLMSFEIERARRLYRIADEGIGYIPRGRRYPITVARELYAGILDRIEAQRYNVFSHRVETSTLGKLAVAAKCAARDPVELLLRA